MAERVGAVVTGAGSGIGEQLALGLVRQGYNVALCDVSEDGLKKTKAKCLAVDSAATVYTESVDVSRAEAVETFAQNAVRALRSVRIVINNAGISSVAKIADTSLASMHKVMDVNYWGVVHGTKAFLPHLTEQPAASIVNISSLFGLMGMPLNGAYCSSKFAVKGFSEVLRMELAISSPHIKVVCVHPGGIKTNIVRNAELDTVRLSEAEARLRGLPEGKSELTRQEVIDDFDHNLAKTTAESAAAQILAACQPDGKPSTRLLIGSDCKTADIFIRLLPVSYAHLVRASLTQTGSVFSRVYFVGFVLLAILVAVLAIWLM